MINKVLVCVGVSMGALSGTFHADVLESKYTFYFQDQCEKLVKDTQIAKQKVSAAITYTFSKAIKNLNEKDPSTNPMHDIHKKNAINEDLTTNSPRMYKKYKGWLQKIMNGFIRHSWNVYGIPSIVGPLGEATFKIMPGGFSFVF